MTLLARWPVVAIAMGIALITQMAAAMQSAEDALAIMRKSAAREQEDLRRLDNFLYEIHTVENKLDKSGKVVKTETKVEEVMQLDGTSYEKLISENGKPLSADKARKEQEKLDKELAKRRHESPRQREKRLAEEEKQRKERREVRQEVVEAFTFQLVGEESVSGAKCWKIKATPKEDYRGRTRIGKTLPKFSGMLWVEQGTYRWLRVRAELLDKLTLGGFLASIAPGSQFELVQQQVQQGLWAMQQISVRFSARALFLSLREQSTFTFQNFRKYSAESTFTVTGEVGPANQP